MTHRTVVRLALLCALALLTACGGGGPKKRVFPPSASVQQLTVLADGRWSVQVRLQNFSNVTQRFSDVSGILRIGGNEAARLQFAPDLAVGPESVEIFTLELAPSSASAQAVNTALDARRSVRYEIEGVIVSIEPGKRTDDFRFASQLTAIPGLTGVLR
jgi:hypothetical protein